MARAATVGGALLKQSIPWPIKFGIKLMLGAARVDYRLLKRAGIVEHGRMEHADFSTEIFDLHVKGPSRECNVPPAGTLLELGPGDSVATGVLGRAAGFAAVELVDAGCFADLRPEALTRLFTSLGAEPPRLEKQASPAEILAQLRNRGINYRIAGAQSLRDIAEGSIAHSFSNTVLQHVYRAELPDIVKQLGRVHARGSIGSHSVNFTDHFSGGFVNHKLPDWMMESSLVKRGNLYTNRVSSAQFLELFAAAGLNVRKLRVDFFDGEPDAHAEYDSAEQFRKAAGSRPILRTIFLVQKS